MSQMKIRFFRDWTGQVSREGSLGKNAVGTTIRKGTESNGIRVECRFDSSAAEASPCTPIVHEQQALPCAARVYSRTSVAWQRERVEGEDYWCRGFWQETRLRCEPRSGGSYNRS